MKEKKAFFILCVFAVVLCVFLLFPLGQDAHGEGEQGKTAENDMIYEEKNAEESPPLYISEWDEDEFSEDKEEEILGTFARKEKEETIFIYFDRQDTYLKEIHRGEESEKELGSYHLKGDVLTLGGADFSFERDGDDLIIDGKRWEYLDGIILSIV